MPRRPGVGARLAAAVVAVVAVVAGACSGDDGAPAAGTPTTVPASTTSTTSTTLAGPFAFAVDDAVTTADLGASWREGCPIGPEDLRPVRIAHWGIDGQVHQGRLIVAADLADDVLDAFRDLYAARYPIERVEPVSAYGADDIASVLANNTSAFNCRYVAGTTRWSEHAYGRAIDLNPRVNPYITSGGTVVPEESSPYVDREQDVPGMIRDGDPAVVAFESRGWVWGGRWASGKDYQHFSTTGR